MEFAPKGLKVGDEFDDNGKRVRVTKVFDFGYNTEPVEEQISLDDLPFAPVEEAVEEAPKKRRRSAKN